MNTSVTRSRSCCLRTTRRPRSSGAYSIFMSTISSARGAIAQLLNSEGRATRAGVPFSARTVIHMLSNPIYVGKVAFKDNTYAGLDESLVAEETFATAPRILRERGESQALKRGHAADYLLSGVVRCGPCGRAYIGTAATGR